MHATHLSAYILTIFSFDFPLYSNNLASTEKTMPLSRYSSLRKSTAPEYLTISPATTTTTTITTTTTTTSNTLAPSPPHSPHISPSPSPTMNMNMKAALAVGVPKPQRHKAPLPPTDIGPTSMTFEKLTFLSFQFADDDSSDNMTQV